MSIKKKYRVKSQKEIRKTFTSDHNTYSQSNGAVFNYEMFECCGEILEDVNIITDVGNYYLEGRVGNSMHWSWACDWITVEFPKNQIGGELL